MSSPPSMLYDTLPKLLQNFFTKYPPSIKYKTASTFINDPLANPFHVNKNPITNKYHAPIYSKRRINVLYKLAIRYGIQDLLPSLPSSHKGFYLDKYNNKQLLRTVIWPKGHMHERKTRY